MHHRFMNASALLPIISLAGLPLALGESPPPVPPGFDACPADVRSAVLKAAGSDPVTKLRVVRRGERTLYLVDIDRAGDYDLKLQLLASGEVLRRSEDMPISGLPEPVAKALTAAAGPTGIIDEIKKVTEGTMTHFKAEIDRPGEPELDVKVAPDGTVLEQKSEKPETPPAGASPAPTHPS
jgi:hypothetical protein